MPGTTPTDEERLDKLEHTADRIEMRIILLAKTVDRLLVALSISGDLLAGLPAPTGSKDATELAQRAPRSDR